MITVTDKPVPLKHTRWQRFKQLFSPYTTLRTRTFPHEPPGASLPGRVSVHRAKFRDSMFHGLHSDEMCHLSITRGYPELFAWRFHLDYTRDLRFIPLFPPRNQPWARQYPIYYHEHTN